jgi:sialate O-acetylesterase
MRLFAQSKLSWASLIYLELSMHFRVVTFAAISLLTVCAQAEVRLASLFTDHAVLQRDTPLHVWGEAAPGETVTIAFHAQSVHATANSLGLWEGWLAPETAGGPYTLSVKGSSTVTRTDVLVGDVWFASGQSNMEMPLAGFPPTAHVANASQEIAQADLPQVRLLRLDHISSDSPLAQIAASWQTCTPATAKDFSAVAYFYARDINRREHVPIGVIDSSWGGTPIDSWISLNALAADASLMPAFANRAQFADMQTHLALAEAAEKRADAEAATQHLPRPEHPWHPDPVSWIPAGLYNGMVAPFTPYSIKGFLWYQGETDSAPERAGLYARMLPTLIADWRAQWHQGNLPFLFVQISSFESPHENWGLIRDSQRRALDVVDTAMAVTLDIGQRDNVHPPDKQTVGARLALAGRALAYGEPGLAYRGPLYRQTTREGSALRVWFDDAAGLHGKGGAIQGFEIAGADGRFVPATATIEGETVLVTSPEAAAPTQVRYGWASYTDANLYNAVWLPASTFMGTAP